MYRVELILDEDDFRDVEREITLRQVRDRDVEGGTTLPPGKSNLTGALLAEVVRDLWEYRAMFDAARREGLI